MKTIDQRVKEEIAKHLEIQVDVIANESSIESLGADSMDCLEILMKIENEFEIDIDDDLAVECNTIGAMVALVESYVKRK